MKNGGTGRNTFQPCRCHLARQQRGPCIPTSSSKLTALGQTRARPRSFFLLLDTVFPNARQKIRTKQEKHSFSLGPPPISIRSKKKKMEESKNQKIKLRFPRKRNIRLSCAFRRSRCFDRKKLDFLKFPRRNHYTIEEESKREN